MLCLDLVTITLSKVRDSESGLVMIGKVVGIWKDGWEVVILVI